MKNDRTQRLIAIRNRGITTEAFSAFMALAEEEFNRRSHANPHLYKACSSDELEKVTERLLIDISPATPFLKEDIRLVSGHSFPDIMATDFYGVEVKQTSTAHWTSTGSSIVETTRAPWADKIYMLFGSLGQEPPAFLCRPYEECLSGIAVTHSPRYLIDMHLREKGEKTIFEKLRTTYDSFRRNPSRIDMVRQYYVAESLKHGKHEMPWWVGRHSLSEDLNEETKRLGMWSDSDMQEELKAQMVVLFPEVIKGDYANAALWLCTHRYLICLNLRDQFTAGGQWKKLNGKTLETPLPHVLGVLLRLMPLVKTCFSRSYELEIEEFHPEFIASGDAFEAWLEVVLSMFSTYTYIVKKKKVRFKDLNINLRFWLTHPADYILSF